MSTLQNLLGKLENSNTSLSDVAKQVREEIANSKNDKMAISKIATNLSVASLAAVKLADVANTPTTILDIDTDDPKQNELLEDISISLKKELNDKIFERDSALQQYRQEKNWFNQMIFFEKEKQARESKNAQTTIELKKAIDKGNMLMAGVYGSKIGGAGVGLRSAGIAGSVGIGKALGGIGKIGLKAGPIIAGIATMGDFFEGLEDVKLKDNTKMGAGIATALSGGDDSSTLGNALKLGALGAQLGVIFGPVGIAIGGLLGASLGAIFANINTKKIANFLDDKLLKPMAFLFKSDFWFGRKGVFNWIVNLPRTIQDWFVRKADQAMELTSSIIDYLIMPFKKDFWLGDNGVLKKLGIPEINVKEVFVDTSKAIIDYLLIPFKKDFWLGDNGILTKTGNLFDSIGDKIVVMMENIRLGIIEYVTPKKDSVLGKLIRGHMPEIAEKLYGKNYKIDDLAIEVMKEAQRSAETLKNQGITLKPLNDISNPVIIMPNGDALDTGSSTILKKIMKNQNQPTKSEEIAKTSMQMEYLNNMGRVPANNNSIAATSVTQNSGNSSTIHVNRSSKDDPTMNLLQHGSHGFRN